MIFKVTTTIRHNETNVVAIIKHSEAGESYILILKGEQRIFEYTKKGYCTSNVDFIVNNKLLSQVCLN